MSLASPTLHMLCGKIASGKSTLAAQLAEQDGTLLIAEDAWLSVLFSDQMASGPDYVRCAAKLRNAMGPHIAALLNAGVSVVLDFPANTVENRAWMRGILDATGAAHRLHVLDTPDEVCLARLRTRNADGDHPFAVTDEQFHRFSKHFVASSPDVGFDLEVQNAGEMLQPIKLAFAPRDGGQSRQTFTTITQSALFTIVNINDPPIQSTIRQSCE